MLLCFLFALSGEVCNFKSTISLESIRKYQSSILCQQMVTTTFKIVKLVKSLQASPKETTDRVSLPANLDVDYF